MQTAVKYLGHYIYDDLSDDMDIYRQCRLIYTQANMLSQNFGMCTVQSAIRQGPPGIRTQMQTAHRDTGCL